MSQFSNDMQIINQNEMHVISIIKRLFLHEKKLLFRTHKLELKLKNTNAAYIRLQQKYIKQRQQENDRLRECILHPLRPHHQANNYKKNQADIILPKRRRPIIDLTTTKESIHNDNRISVSIDIFDSDSNKDEMEDKDNSINNNTNHNNSHNGNHKKQNNLNTDEKINEANEHKHDNVPNQQNIAVASMVNEDVNISNKERSTSSTVIISDESNNKDDHICIDSVPGYHNMSLKTKAEAISHKVSEVIYTRCVRIGNSYQCTFCNGMYSSRNSLRSHLFAIHCEMKPWCCRFCRAKFSTKALRNSHEKQTFYRKKAKEAKRRRQQRCNLPKLSGQILTKMKPSVVPLSCDHCDKLFVTRNVLNMHKKICKLAK